MNIAYNLKFYVRDLYAKNAGKRGGEVFKPMYKKDIKPFKIRVSYAINMPKNCLQFDRYPITAN